MQWNEKFKSNHIAFCKNKNEWEMESNKHEIRVIPVHSYPVTLL